ncbi:chemotaxis protein CheW [Leptothoe sp. ISB3NOV94-8A]
MQTTQKPIERLQALLPDVFEPQTQTGELYLKFYLGSSLTVVIPLVQVVETLRISAHQVSPIPNMPASVLGLMSHQGKILWVLDLPKLLEVPQKDVRSRQYDIIVVEVMLDDGQESDCQFLGLYVPQIQGTLRMNPEDLIPSFEEIMPGLAPYLQGQFQGEDEKLFLLDVDAICSAESLYVYTSSL